MVRNEEFEWFSNLMYSILSSNDEWIKEYEKVSNKKCFDIDPEKVKEETN